VRNVFSQLWYAAARFVGSSSPLRSLRDMATELARAELALRDVSIPRR
jgi:hypothetical protein